MSIDDAFKKPETLDEFVDQIHTFGKMYSEAHRNVYARNSIDKTAALYIQQYSPEDKVDKYLELYEGLK